MIRYFLNKSIVTICLNVSILLVGYFALPHIANEFIPAIEIPAVGVVFPTTILSHQTVTHQLVEPLERRLLASGDVEKIETTLDQDRVILFIFYKWSLTPESCLQRARQLVSSQKRPEGVLEPLFILHRPTMSPIYRVAFYGPSAPQLTRTLQSLGQRLERLPGVASIGLVGATPEEGSLQVLPQQTARLKVLPEDILQSALQTWSFRYLFSTDSKENPQILRLGLKSVEDLKDLNVEPSQKSVPVKWISKVESSYARPSVFFGKDKEAVVLEVVKAPGSDALQIVDAVSASIDQLKTQMPSIQSQVIYNEADQIRKAQAGVLQNFLVGVTLNSIILIVFLGSIIGAVVASCVFPTAILGTLYVMKVSDISLNIFALNGFSLASGMITDASIVVLESIMRRFQQGQELMKSCDHGTRDVFIGVIASALTTAAVIVPITLQTGVSAKLFSDLGMVLVATQFISLVAVFTFVPWLCSRTLSEDQNRPLPIDYLFRASSILVTKMNQLAQQTLQRSVKDRKYSVGIPVTVTVLSLAMLTALPNSEFLPVVASKIYSLSVPVPRIDLLEKGNQLQKKVAHTVGAQSDVKWSVTSHDLDMVKSTFEVTQASVVPDLVKTIATDLEVPVQRVSALPVGPTPNSEPLGYDGYFFLRSDIEPSKKDQLVSQFCSAQGLVDCNGTSHYKESRVILKPNPLQMAQAHTNILSTTVNLASLTRDLDLASLANLPFSLPIFMRLPKSTSLTDFPLLVGAQKEQSLTLGSAFSSRFQTGSNVRFRRDGHEFDPLYFRIQGLTIGQAVAEAQKIASQVGVKMGQLIPMGSIETMNDTFDKMITALILSSILILLVLVIQFRSIAQALIIMYSMPLSLGGAILGLLIMGETLNVGVIVGFILLIGIIVNNGILLMDAINQRRLSGMDLLSAIQESVESRTRPILMTTFSTVFGMLPTLLFEAEGKELYQGMAIVNIFGMIFGTFLTLVVTPLIIRSILLFQSRQQGVLKP